ncbi:MAG: acetate/propionate family kinase, partial [Candidatus Binatia bacterium]
AHEAMWRRWCELRPDLDRGGRLITLQLGAGSSMAAIDRGQPLDTSMGFSPLEGLVMATRSGDLDPAIVPFLQTAAGLGPDEVLLLLLRESGLLGVSGLSADMQTLLESAAPAARLAVDLYAYRARKSLGAYLAVLGGADGVVFGGGVGENAPPVREKIAAGMEWCGLVLDHAANRAARGERRLSAPGSAIEAWVIPVDEEAVLAREAFRLVSAREEA